MRRAYQTRAGCVTTGSTFISSLEDFRLFPYSDVSTVVTHLKALPAITGINHETVGHFIGQEAIIALQHFREISAWIRSED